MMTLFIETLRFFSRNVQGRSTTLVKTNSKQIKKYWGEKGKEVTFIVVQQIFRILNGEVLLCL